MRLIAAAVIVGAPALETCGAHSEPIEVRWELPAGPGASGVAREGCLGWEFDEVGAGRWDVRPGFGACSLVGWKRDGLLEVTTAPVRIHPDVAVQHVAFELPPGPLGGLGIEVTRSCAGVAVAGVVPGSPADRAGLVRGERIRAIDGASTRRQSLPSFVRRAVGEPGTSVDLLVEGVDGERLVSVEREPIR